MKVADELHNRKNWLLVGVLSAAVFVFVVAKVLGEDFLRPYYYSILVSASFIAFSSVWSDGEVQLLPRVLLYLLSLAFAAEYIQEAYIVFSAEPSLWDFTAFYLDSNVAASGMNLYDPNSYALVSERLDLKIDDEFRQEILDVGFKYPPVTALLFMPMAGLNMYSANTYWLTFVTMTVISTCLLAAYCVCARTGKQHKILHLADALALALVVILSCGVFGTGLSYAQTSALVCCLLLLVYSSDGSRIAGVSAALAVLVKPFAVIPGIALATGQRWPAIVVGIFVGLFFGSLSVFVLGLDDWISYLSLEFANNSPPWLYNNSINQSLMVRLTKAFGIYDVPWGYPIFSLTYAGLSSLILGSSLYLATKNGCQRFGSSLSLLTLAGLIVYPGTLSTYKIIFAAVLVVEGAKAIENGLPLWSLAMMVFVITLASHYSLFWAATMSWTVLTWVLFSKARLPIQA